MNDSVQVNNSLSSVNSTDDNSTITTSGLPYYAQITIGVVSTYAVTFSTIPLVKSASTMFGSSAASGAGNIAAVHANLLPQSPSLGTSHLSNLV